MLSLSCSDFFFFPCLCKARADQTNLSLFTRVRRPSWRREDGGPFGRWRSDPRLPRACAGRKAQDLRTHHRKELHAVYAVVWQHSKGLAGLAEKAREEAARKEGLHPGGRQIAAAAAAPTKGEGAASRVIDGASERASEERVSVKVCDVHPSARSYYSCTDRRHNILSCETCACSARQKWAASLKI